METMEITAVVNCPTLIRGETVAAGETRTVDDCYYWREQVRNGSVTLQALTPNPSPEGEGSRIEMVSVELSSKKSNTLSKR